MAEQLDVHLNQLQDLKNKLLEQTYAVFGSGQGQKAADESQRNDPHAKIVDHYIINGA